MHVAHWRLAGGAAAALIGGGLAVPVVVAQAELRSPTGHESWLLLSAGVLGAGGVVAFVAGLWQRRGRSMPGGVRAAVTANVFLLGFCGLELSDRLVRQQGRVFYWTTFLFLFALVTFYGLVAARRWAWWVCRVATALATLWFLAWVPLIPFGDVRGEGGPVPWYGRLFMMDVCVAFSLVSAAAFWSLGHPAARAYFGFAPQNERTAP